MKTMNTTNGMIEKRTYCSPVIEKIKLDNEISLVLASDDPPTYENNHSKVPEFLKSDPFKENWG